tara:strand:+ start:69 stop:374 length:306 start_codon:yes stop_codon:yes gene_type:complete
MSLRKTAKIIGVSAPYLSQMINGRRPWNTEIKARYDALPANTFANTRVVNSAESVQNVANTTRKEPYIAEVISSTLIPPTIPLGLGMELSSFFAPFSWSVS